MCVPWEKEKFKRLDEQLENLKAEQQAKKAEPKKRNSLLYSVKETKHFPSNSTQEMPPSDLSKEISNKRVPKK